jgi:hypothetical protein
MSNSDITIAPPLKFDPRARVTPVYLVVSMDGTFLATKFDDSPNYGKFVGFYTSVDLQIIKKDFQELINSVDKALYTEMMIPWHRVLSVQSLIFRTKQ